MSFVQLANEDSERDDKPAENIPKKRAVDDVPEVEAATSKKRSVAFSYLLSP